MSNNPKTKKEGEEGEKRKEEEEEEEEAASFLKRTASWRGERKPGSRPDFKSYHYETLIRLCFSFLISTPW